MTDEDVTFIERELGLTLPASYRRAVVPFPVPALRGNTEHHLWDDAAALVRLNRRLRAAERYRPAWPPYMFAVGDPHGDEVIAVDTRDPEGPVWWLDHAVIGHKYSYQSHARFADWAEEFYRDMRHDLESDGRDPDAAPEPPK